MLSSIFASYFRNRILTGKYVVLNKRETCFSFLFFVYIRDGFWSSKAGYQIKSIVILNSEYNYRNHKFWSIQWSIQLIPNTSESLLQTLNYFGLPFLDAWIFLIIIPWFPICKQFTIGNKVPMIESHFLSISVVFYRLNQDYWLF